MKRILIELSPIYLLITSIILFLLLSALGVIHLIGKSIYSIIQLKFKKFIIEFIKYWLYIVYQIWNSIKFICLQTAIGIDILGNATCGEAIEDCITSEESTLFGKGDLTISTAIGELESKNKLNKTGIKFSKFLSKVLDENHCIESYNRYLHNKKFKL